MAVCLPAAGAALRALAQSATKPKQIVLVYNSIALADLAGHEPADREARTFLRAMRDLGWVDGRNVAIRFLSAEGRFERLPALLAQVAQSGADVIVASGLAASEAKKATDTVPIVGVIPDAESGNLIGDPQHPRRNVTAVTTDLGALMPKRLELLKAIAPRASRVAMLTDPERAGSEASEVEASARTLGLTLAWIKVAGGVEGVDAGLARALDEKVDAIAVDDTRVNFAARKAIAEFALQHRLPTTSAFEEFVEAGGLMAYEANLDERVHSTARYVDKILKGTKPADLPVVRPTVFDLTVNARTASALGLVVPPTLQLRITRTIE